MSDIFRKFSRRASVVLGSPWAFMLAAASIVVWAVTGPLYHFSNTWQLIANTGTTLITFLMVFIIQNTQNRDGKAIQLKLDELLQGVQGARTGLVDLEDMGDNDLDTLQKQFAALHVRLSELGAATVEGETVGAGTVETGTVEADHIDAAEHSTPRNTGPRPHPVLHVGCPKHGVVLVPERGGSHGPERDSQPHLGRCAPARSTMNATYASPDEHHKPICREIRVKGRLDARWVAWFHGPNLSLKCECVT